MTNDTSPYTFRDIDILTETARHAGFDAQYIQLDSGQLHFNCFRRSLMRMELVWEEVDRSIEYWGSGPTDYYSFMLLVEGPKFRTNGFAAGVGKLFYVPPGKELHIITGGYVKIMSITCPANRIPLNFHTESVIPINLYAQDEKKLLSLARACSSMCLSDALKQNLEILLGQVLARIIAKNEHFSHKDKFGRRMRWKSISKVRELIHEDVFEPPRVSRMAREACVTERTLERLFRKELGISPAKYCRILRLDGARKVLTNEVCNKSVTEAALEYGFQHFGRFSKEFRQHFGLLPSELKKFQRSF